MHTDAERRKRDREYARALEEDAELGDEPCNDLVEAAGYWHEAGEHEQERAALARAREIDPDTGPLSGRGAYIAHLITHGRAEEAAPLLEAERRSPSQVEFAYSDISQAYAAIGDHQRALRWLNIGINRLVPDLHPDLDMSRGDPGYELLRARSELRAENGLPPDAIDEFFAQVDRRAEDGAAQIAEIMRGAPALTEQERPGALGWTAEEFARVQREHPDWYPGSTHEDHRREVERALGRATGGRVVPAALDDVRAWAAAEGLDPADPATRSEYAAELARTTRGVPWPPGRNDACWCGSGRKYKKCCGAPGFA
ncbi:SEC-C metal-binding domain-containing protein [Saccharopolyspora griseoalba]|uniref:SEC-C metal-binding domain-containing protein n=1 Tax=Saccharopolyspora griseoalba TaxID=1431848 RepID=A0ABW2LHV8_9PSEU